MSALDKAAEGGGPVYHEAHFEWDGYFVSAACSCGDFYRICESQSVAKREHANHVDLTAPIAWRAEGGEQ